MPPENHPTAPAPAQTAPAGTAREVFGVFLKLGLTAFGGPIAHLGYFRDEIVTRRNWLDDRAYGDLVALCQFLPGPASSQTGLALGLMRAGWRGALAAFAGFTLPSALAMLGFALVAGQMDGPLAAGLLHGLKIVAVAIVAQAVLGMARTLCPDRARAAIALAALGLMAFLPGAAGMVAAMATGALAGLLLPRGQPVAATASFPVERGTGIAALGLCAALLILLPLLAPLAPALAVADGFYRAGTLVFGGGHVVLPLLEAETVRTGWIGADSFLAGYGAAQAVPGPLFTFAAYLGALIQPGPGGIAGAALAMGALFLPGFLLLIGCLPFWSLLRSRPAAQAAMQGANAAVVGLLAAALYDPVFTSAITGPPDFALAASCFILLTLWKAPPWLVVLLAAAGGMGLAVLAHG